MDHGPGIRNTEQPVPIYVAANGPLALKTAGMYGDGLVSLFNERADTLSYNLGMVKEGASDVGRGIGPDFHTTALTASVVLKPGEKLTEDRVIEAAGSWVVCCIHFVYEVWQYTKNDEVIPEYFQNLWDQYLDHVAQMKTPEDRRYQEIHEGHCSFYVESEREFITPEAIEGTCLVGEPAKIADQIRKTEAMGLGEVSVLPPMAGAREQLHDFANKVMPLL